MEKELRSIYNKQVSNMYINTNYIYKLFILLYKTKAIILKCIK